MVSYADSICRHLSCACLIYVHAFCSPLSTPISPLLYLQTSMSWLSFDSEPVGYNFLRSLLRRPRCSNDLVVNFFAPPAPISEYLPPVPMHDWPKMPRRCVPSKVQYSHFSNLDPTSSNTISHPAWLNSWTDWVHLDQKWPFDIKSLPI